MQHDTAPGMQCLANLNKEDAEKVKAERDRFLKATQDLRQEIMSKELILQSELVKPATDIQKATALQKELSALEAELDQKRLLHLLEIKKISPDAAAGCMSKSRGDMGKGCPMMGR
jgi:zinc resistance-associated protein